MSRKTKWIPAVSLALNLVFLVTTAFVILERGGMTYLRTRFSGSSLWLSAVQDPQHWANRQSFFLQLAPRTSRPIVFLGDSITEYGEWSELLGGAGVIVNRGIGSDTTQGLLSRLDAVNAMRPRAVFLMIGTNDQVGPGLEPAETARNYKLIVDRLLQASPGLVVYAQSILPVAESRTERSNKWIADVNERIRGVANGKDVIYVDLYKDFVSGSSLNPQYSADGLHLNGDGYVLWGSRVAPFIRFHLAQ